MRYGHGSVLDAGGSRPARLYVEGSWKHVEYIYATV